MTQRLAQVGPRHSIQMSASKQPMREARRLLKDPIVLPMLGINGLVAVLTIFPILDENSTYLLLESWVLVPISILGILAPWVALPPMKNPREKTFWGLWSLGLFFHLTVRVTYLILPNVDYVVGGSLLIDVLYTLFYLPLIFSLLVRPDEESSEEDGRAVRLLEVVGTGIFVLVMLVYFVFIPRTFNHPEYETWVPSLLMYWVFDAFLLLSLFYLRETSPSRDWKIIYSWLAIAPACWVVTEMIELQFYMDWDGTGWPGSFWDFLWYLPWMAITVAGRVRVHPVPALFGAGHRDEEASEMSRFMGRPGWLQISAMALPVIHFGSNLLGLMDPGTRNIREVVVLVSLVLLLGMAAFHQKLLEARALALARRSQEAEAREKLLAAAVEQSPDAVLIADAKGVIRYGNRAFGERVAPPGEVQGASLLDVLPQGLVGRDGNNAMETLAPSLAEGKAWEGKIQANVEGGPEAEEMLTVSPVWDGEGSVAHWVMIRRDVTYLSQLERHLLQAQRMEAVGALARGMATDLQQLLGRVYGYGESLKEELGQDSRTSEDLVGLLDATERTAQLVGRVLAFSQAGEEKRARFFLSGFVRDTLAVLKENLPPSIRLVERIHSDSGEILGVRHQIRQVVLNLSGNALQAMEASGGTLTVEVRDVEVGQEEADTWELPAPGDYALLSVRDNGRGMDSDTLRRAFDPFFTTKGAGSGVGLGLYLVRETVMAHGGGVQVQSKPGTGTVFQVYLPLAGGEGVEPVSVEDANTGDLREGGA